MNQTIRDQIFESVSRTNIRTWLEFKRNQQVEILCANPDHNQILKAQGAVAVIDEMLQRIAAARS